VPEAAVSHRSKTVAFFDHLVGNSEQRHFEAERLGFFLKVPSLGWA